MHDEMWVNAYIFLLFAIIFRLILKQQKNFLSESENKTKNLGVVCVEFLKVSTYMV